MTSPSAADIGPRSHDAWMALAGEVAAALAADIARRHRDHTPPHDQIRLLKASGLATMAVPAASGGGGARWSTVVAVARELAAVDGSVGTLFGYHSMGVLHQSIGRPALAGPRLAEIARDRLWLAGVTNPRDDDVQVRPDGGDVVLDGTKSFCTGAAFADRLVVWGRRTDTGAPVLVYLRGDAPGLRCHHDWDSLGLDRADSGGFTLDGVRVPAADMQMEDRDGVDAFAVAARTPVNQLTFANLYLGFALGAFRAGRDYVRTSTRAWPASGVARAVDDPLVVSQFGEFWIAIQAVVALADRAAGKVDAMLDAAPRFDAQLRGDAAVDVATIKVLSSRLSLDVATRIYDAMGARATHNRHAFDRFWRDARTHTLHDPLAYKILEIGHFALNARLPEPQAYS
ncbi:FMNH2-dependent monooxygenase [Tistrella bauzanensis]|uniref:Dibenzothiophene monooxygenase n=1 Tax=Tistrella bauzanensis TaxID=657419 RepID=A0ABQ1I9A5_9PROT|nr:acyl-CoA dehydrogenase family protein [Tistrella bauzanensis]GGB28275.1 FMNH2-dependent monooxygenase [Tistrella bauzanensis]